MPEMPDELFLGSIEEPLKVDGAWVPSGEDRSLYLRPFMFATEVGLGVRPANEYVYLLIASPAGPYFPEGVKPVVCGCARTTFARRPGNRRGQVRGQLRRVPRGASGGDRARLRSGRLARCRGAPMDRKRWAG